MKILTLLALLLGISSCQKKRANEVAEDQSSSNALTKIIQIEDKLLPEISGYGNFHTTPIFQLDTLVTKLNQADFETYIEYEIKSLLTTAAVPLKPTKAAVSDTIPSSRQYCLTSDENSDTIPRSFGNNLLFYRFRPIIINIPISVHLIKRNNTPLRKLMSELRLQLDTLNKAFAPANLRFSLASIDSISNEDWFYCRPKFFENEDRTDSIFERMTSHLSNPNMLNLYINDMPKFDGLALFPWDSRHRTNRDCIMIRYSSLPGRPGPQGKREGNTLVHEMGHFFGLFHTFHDDKNPKNSCDSGYNNGCKTGDLLPDTNPQKICHVLGCGKCRFGRGCSDCTPPIKTCTTCPGSLQDPVTNYMGYNPDTCMGTFTEDQIERIIQYATTKRSYLSRELFFIQHLFI